MKRISETDAARPVDDADQNALLETLRIAGLTSEEARVYAALLAEPASSASKVSKASRVTRGRIYSILENLEARGLCGRLVGKITYYRANNPMPFLDNVKSDRLQGTRTLEKVQAQLAGRYDSRPRPSHPLDAIELIPSDTAYRERYFEAEAAATSEVLDCNKLPIITGAEDLPEDTPSIEAVRRGVRIRMIQEEPVFSLRGVPEATLHYEDAGLEIRVLPQLPAKYAIFDRRTVIFTVARDSTERANMPDFVIQNAELAEALREGFEALWGRAQPLREFLTRSAGK